MQHGDEFGEIDDLHASVRGGTRAVLISQLLSQLLSLGVLAVMYRLHLPDAYGLLGRILPAVMIPRMAATLGLATAVVQHPKLSRSQLSQLFWWNVAAGVLASIATAVAGPVLAAMYDRPELAWLGLGMAGCNLAASLGNHHQALLERTLRLGRLSVVRIAAQLVGGGSGIAVALAGGGVWSLVAQQFAELAAIALGVWIAMPWRPGLPARGESVGSLLQFSSFYSLSTLVTYVAQNLEKIVFPVLLANQADRAIGLYSQAFGLVIKPVYLITSPLIGVMVAALARVRHDPRTYTDLTTRFFRLAAIGLFPCAAGLMAVAPDVMLVLAGDAWRDAGPLLTAMAPLVFALGLINLSGILLASVGRPGQLLFSSLVYCLLLVQAFLVGYYYAGGYFRELAAEDSLDLLQARVLGAAYAMTIVTIVVWLIPFLWFCFRSARVQVSSVLQALAPVIQPAVMMGLVVWGLRQVLLSTDVLPAWGRLIILVAVGVLLYALLARRELQWFLAEWIHLRSNTNDVQVRGIDASKR